jgi:hypothetical protein
LFFAFCTAHSELQSVAWFQMQIGLKVACANGGPLRIKQNRDGAAGRLGEPANAWHNFADPLMGRVTHVQSENISPFLD